MKSRMLTVGSAIDEVILACEVCNVGMIDDENMPYTLPFNFGYEDQTVYLHSAPVGRKIEVLEANPNVCISFSTAHEMYKQSEEMACSYGMRYKSALVKGKVEFVEDYDEKVRILNIIMRQYTKRDDFKYSAPSVKNVKVMKVKATSIEGKLFGY